MSNWQVELLIDVNMRTELISTSRLKTFKKFYKVFFISINIIGLGIAIPLIIKSGMYVFLLQLPVLWFFTFKALKNSKKLKTISYDDSSVYYEKDGYEVQIPFEEIKNIELYEGWAINLYRPAQDGDRIMFLPSIWYPFNFRKKDAEIDKLRDKIDQFKRSMPMRNLDGLSSHHI